MGYLFKVLHNQSHGIAIYGFLWDIFFLYTISVTEPHSLLLLHIHYANRKSGNQEIPFPFFNNKKTPFNKKMASSFLVSHLVGKIIH